MPGVFCHTSKNSQPYQENISHADQTWKQGVREIESYVTCISALSIMFNIYIISGEESI